jgi:hypothetical protein
MFNTTNKFWVYFHAVAAIIWALMGIPTILFWKESILWVAIMSIYAIVVSHWSAYQASRAEVEVNGANNQT